MLLPRDLIDEIERELSTCSRQLAVDSRRAKALLELHAEAVVAAARLGRPPSVFEYLDGAPDPEERTRRIAQRHALRASHESLDARGAGVTARVARRARGAGLTARARNPSAPRAGFPHDAVPPGCRRDDARAKRVAALVRRDRQVDTLLVRVRARVVTVACRSVTRASRGWWSCATGNVDRLRSCSWPGWRRCW
jgi:hypothetical protein